jgi:cold shock CspA family protein
MPVDTRRVTHAAGTQPASMGAGGQDLDPNENKPKNEQQEDKTPPEPMPSPRTPTPGAHALAAELADVEFELASAKRTADKLRSRANARAAHQSAQADKKSSAAPSPPPRPRIEDESAALDMQELGDIIGNSFKTALSTVTKEDTGSLISKEEAALVQCDLSLASRKGFVAMIRNKGRLVDDRMDALYSLLSGSPKEIPHTIERLGLKHLDKRLAATIFKCLKEKAPHVIKLMKVIEKDPSLGVSGVLIFKWLDEETEKVMRTAPEDLKLAFDSETFLRCDAAKEVNEVNAMEMLSAIEALPDKYNGSQRDALQLILDKIPVQAQGEHWVATLHNEFRRAIRSGGEMPWTQEGLCDEIIDNLKRSATIKPRAQVAQRPPTGPASKNGEGGARASRLKDKVLTGTIGKWLGETRSFCFIKIKDEKDNAFCHKNSIIGDKLEEGTEVQLKLVYDIPATAKRGEERREFATEVRPTTQRIVNTATAAQTEAEQTETELEQSQGQIAYFNTY